jgi:hypothetical protein
VELCIERHFEITKDLFLLSKDNKSILDKLLEYIQSPEASIDMFTINEALVYAVEARSAELVSHLINAYTTIDRKEALRKAAELGYTEIIPLLKIRNMTAYVNPLDWAVANKHLLTVKKILEIIGEGVENNPKSCMDMYGYYFYKHSTLLSEIDFIIKDAEKAKEAETVEMDKKAEKAEMSGASKNEVQYIKDLATEELKNNAKIIEELTAFRNDLQEFMNQLPADTKKV